MVQKMIVMRTLKYIIIAAVFLGAGFLLGKTAIAPTAPAVSCPPCHEAGQLSAVSSTSLMLDFGNGSVSTYNAPLKTDATVFSLLQEAVQAKNLALDFQNYPEMGVFVKQIGEQKNGGDKFWQYWVNNVQVQVAADKAQLKAVDVVEWKFIKSQPMS